LLEGKRARVVDEPKLLAEVQASGERAWEAVPSWPWNNATVDDISPMSYLLVSG